MLNRLSPGAALLDDLTILDPAEVNLRDSGTTPMVDAADEATETRMQRAHLSWERHLEDLSVFYSHYGRTPSSIRPVNAGEERLARWWHRQIVAAGRQLLTAEQVCLLDHLFTAGRSEARENTDYLRSPARSQGRDLPGSPPRSS